MSVVERLTVNIDPNELCHFQEFPCEILVEIFSKLDRTTAMKCREVCSKWKIIIEDSNTLRQTLFNTKTVRNSISYRYIIIIIIGIFSCLVYVFEEFLRKKVEENE